MTSFSVILPFFNEQKRLPDTLKEIIKFLKKHPSSEAIFVSDGCTDHSTQIVLRAMKKMNRIRLIHYSPNKGKWKAITTGIKRARKQIIITSDSDWSIDLARVDIINFEENTLYLLDRYSVLVNFRKFLLHRFIAGRIYTIYVRLLLNIPVNDFQTPVKCFPNSPKIQEIANEMTTFGFAGDVELITLAKRKDMNIEEHGTLYQPKSADSKVRVLKHGWQMAKDIFKIYKKYGRCP